MSRIFYVFCLVSFCMPALAQKGEKIELLNANSLQYDRSVTGNVKRLIGDVKFRQKETILTCDSAYQYDEENRVEAFGDVRINHEDSLFFYARKLKYDGNTRKARLEEKVRMVDKTMELTSSDLDFDMVSNTGHYSNKGRIVSGDNVLTSQYGYYYSNTKEVYFKKNVLLVNPEYTIESDTLRYNTRTRYAFFYGPTTITSDKDKIYCERGTYNTLTQTARFSKNASLTRDRDLLKADSIYYERRQEYGKALGNIEMYDFKNAIVLYGAEGELLGKLGQQRITKNAMARQYLEKDSMFLIADTIYSYDANDSMPGLLKAYRNVKVIKTDMNAVCDSMVYTRGDSILTLYHEPVLWSGPNQSTADTIIMYVINSTLDSFQMLNNAFMISRETSKHFNQVKGKLIHGRFRDGKFRYMHVYGNGQSIYYAKEDSGYAGVNVINCGEMEFFFENNTIERYNCITDPDGTFYPLDELKPEELKLKGFLWRGKDRPDYRLVRKRLGKNDRKL